MTSWQVALAKTSTFAEAWTQLEDPGHFMAPAVPKNANKAIRGAMLN